jgi:hypothetical protein
MYRFAHDRVQEAFYVNMDSTHRMTTHLKIAHILHDKKATSSSSQELFFTIAHHYNEAIELVVVCNMIICFLFSSFLSFFLWFFIICIQIYLFYSRRHDIKILPHSKIFFHRRSSLQRGRRMLFAICAQNIFYVVFLFRFFTFFSLLSFPFFSLLSLTFPYFPSLTFFI